MWKRPINSPLPPSPSINPQPIAPRPSLPPRPSLDPFAVHPRQPRSSMHRTSSFDSLQIEGSMGRDGGEAEPRACMPERAMGISRPQRTLQCRSPTSFLCSLLLLTGAPNASCMRAQSSLTSRYNHLAAPPCTGQTRAPPPLRPPSHPLHYMHTPRQAPHEPARGHRRGPPAPEST